MKSQKNLKKNQKYTSFLIVPTPIPKLTPILKLNVKGSQKVHKMYLCLQLNHAFMLQYVSLPCKMLAGHISILVTTTNTGTFRANARPRCSLVMPTMPALLPTCEGMRNVKREGKMLCHI